MKPLHLGLLLACAPLTLAMANNAWAQSDKSTSPPAAADIVVTAMKNGNSSLQKTAAAVTAISSDVLVKTGANTLSALTSVTPGLQVAPVRTTALVFIRGVGTTITSPNTDPAIAININGAYVPMEMTGSGFFDLDRIEVLPGPQGTLYGRNSTGGVINLITKSVELHRELTRDYH